jgi:multimeric flavodoxin WrbA
MKILILSGSPNRDGLTAACVEAALNGCRATGVSTEHIFLKDFNIGLCHACENGWGTCRDKYECQVLDDFQEIHKNINAADGIILITPVYWGEMSEIMKTLTDRFRRCEAAFKGGTGLKDKPVLGIAAAGGGGGGITSCLSQMERFIQHVGGKRYDFIPITQLSRQSSLRHIEEMAKQFALN